MTKPSEFDAAIRILRKYIGGDPDGLNRELMAAIAALKDYEKVKENLDKAETAFDIVASDLQRREAELEELKDDLLDAQGDAASSAVQADSFAKIANEKEAKLEKFRPLIEAAEGVSKQDLEDDIRFMDQPALFESVAILRAALKCQEPK